MRSDRGDIFAIALVMAILTVTATDLAVAEDVTLKARGEYAQIDTHLGKATIGVLAHGSLEDKQRTIEEIKAAPDKYPPPVLYALSSLLFLDGKKDEGAFWFYAGQLRANFDANRSADTSVGEAVTVMDRQFAAPINRYTFQDLQKLEELILRVVEWDKKTPHNYDQRWINLETMNAIMSGLDIAGQAAQSHPLSLPKEQWDEIAARTRAEYLAGFRQVATQFRLGLWHGRRSRPEVSPPAPVEPGPEPEGVPARAADGACQPVLDAMVKMLGTPTHIYLTPSAGTIGDKLPRENIYLGGAAYVRTASEWRRIPTSLKDEVEKHREMLRKAKAVTCSYLRDESVNGEAASVYSEHLEFEDTVTDSLTWISIANGLPLRSESDYEVVGEMVKVHVSQHFEYTDVQPPADVK